MPYAVVVGEALVDLFESACAGEAVYRPMVGGAPLNVAAGIARLGQPVEFIGSVGVDAFGERIWTLLTEIGVGTASAPRVAVPTTLAVTSLYDGVPEFHFYGDPPSFSLLSPNDIDQDLVGRAGALYCGSITFLYEPALAAARRAWAVPGPLKALDPNVRPSLLGEPGPLRSIVEEFATSADLVKLSEPDGLVLFGLPPEDAAAHLRGLGAAAVVVTLGERGAYADVPGGRFAVPAPAVTAIDTTGAGDASMAGLMHGLLTGGVPGTVEAWRELVQFATTVAAFACETRGGATAMPTMDAVAQRLATATSDRL
jgi:fructokinase